MRGQDQDQESQQLQGSQENIEKNSQQSKQQGPSQIETLQSLLQLDRLDGKKVPWYYKLDIFQFLPTPTQNPVSTKKSFIASILFLLVIGGAPNASQYFEKIPDKELDSPQFAVGYFYGDDVLESWDIRSGTNITLHMYQVQRDLEFHGQYPKIDIPLTFGDDCNFDWIGKDSGVDTRFLMCPDYKKVSEEGKRIVIQGNVEQKSYQYPQIMVQRCNVTEQECNDDKTIRDFLAGGRIQLYLKKNPSKNFITGETIEFNRDYLMYYYFLVPGQYMRHSVNYQIQSINQSPDYFTSFSTQTTHTYYIKNQVYYPSKSYYDKYRLFSIWLTLDSNRAVINYTYNTIIVVGSLLGAFCSVIFSAFTFVFLKYNSSTFYKKNKHWNDIMPTINRIRDINRANQERYRDDNLPKRIAW